MGSQQTGNGMPAAPERIRTPEHHTHVIEQTQAGEAGGRGSRERMG